MTPLDEATRRQHDAAQPGQSTWLSANAGSGKTRVLTDRVARLLLDGVQPQHILCLTYTKAAASEMQNRLFQRLGAWAMLDDDALRAALHALGYTGHTADEDLRRARTLFARAIETPGGLKIQTIHSFCAALLRRFPLEAGVSPQFTEIEDRAAELLRAELLDQMADGPDAPLLSAFAQIYSGDEILRITARIVSNTGHFSLHSLGDALQLFDLPADLTPDRLVRDTFGPGDTALIQQLIPLLAAGSSTDQKAAQKLAAVTTLDISAITALASVFVFASGQKAGQPKTGSFPTKATRDAALALMPDLEALMTRVADAREAYLGLTAAQHAYELHRFAARFATLYAEAKQARAWLDFDDLIRRAATFNQGFAPVEYLAAGARLENRPFAVGDVVRLSFPVFQGLNAPLARDVVFRRSNFHPATVARFHNVLHQALTEAPLTNEDGSVKILQRTANDLGGGSGTTVDEHGYGKV